MTESQTQEAPRVTVVTSENYDQYVNQQLVIVEDTPEKKAEKELTAVEAEKAKNKASEEDPTEEVKDHLPEDKRGKLNKRFSELTEKRKAAEEKAAKLEEAIRTQREAREAAERRAAELQAKYEPPKSDELGPEPQPGQFTDIGEYSKALKDWTAEKTQRDYEAKQAEERSKKEQEALLKTWNDRQAEARKEIADYADTISNSEVMVSNEVRQAILESDVGPKLLYHLAKNPEVADKLKDMSAARALREIGRLEASLSIQAGKKQEAATTVAEISKAPAPISPLKGDASMETSKVDSSGNFIGTYAEYKRLRQAGKIK